VRASVRPRNKGSRGAALGALQQLTMSGRGRDDAGVRTELRGWLRAWRRGAALQEALEEVESLRLERSELVEALAMEEPPDYRSALEETGAVLTDA